MSRGSLPSMAVTCEGLSSLTRSGPETGRGEGRVIASAGSLSVRSGSMRRRAILAAAAIPLFLIALWVRTPALPRTAGTGAALDRERAGAAEGAVQALERAVVDAIESLEARAATALDAPVDVGDAFRYLSTRSPKKDEESVMLFEHDCPFAWFGEMRIDPYASTGAVNVTFNPFYTTVDVSKTRGDRRAVASAVLHAAPPADRLAQSVDSRIAPAQGVASYK